MPRHPFPTERRVRRLEDQIAFLGEHRARAQRRRELAAREITECDQLLAELRDARSDLPGGRQHERRHLSAVSA